MRKYKNKKKMEKIIQATLELCKKTLKLACKPQNIYGFHKIV